MSDEIDVDSRPSDALNLAVRFGAPMYISSQVAAGAITYSPSEGAMTSPSSFSGGKSESNTEIVRTVRETMASYEVRSAQR